MVSVILPTYNRAGFLRNSVESVLGQMGVDLELIVADDGSTDGTEELLRSYRDERIKYYRLPHTGLIGAVKNFAIDRTTGEYLAFMDSDDWWTEGKLLRQLQLLKEYPDLGFSITDMTIFRGGHVLRQSTYDVQGEVRCANIFPWIVDKGFLVYNPTLLIRKDCLKLTGYFNETFTAGCLGFNMRLAYHYQCGVFFEPMLLRRLHDTNHSEEWKFQNYDEYLDTYERLYTEGKINSRQLHRARGNAFFKLGVLHAAERQLGEARKHYWRALQNDPFHVGCYKSLIKSFL